MYMFELGGSPTTVVEAALGQLSAAVDTLTGLELTRLDRDNLLSLLRGLETQRRRLPVVDHALVAELDQRGVAGELAARDTKTLLRDVLRLTPHQAAARYDAAVDLGPRRGLTGEVLPPLLPAVAAAQADGVLSPEHAKVITTVVEELPPVMEPEQVSAVKQRLVTEAARFDPSVLARIGRHLLERINPDGSEDRDAQHDRRRTASLTCRRDGSGMLKAHLTPAALAQWQAVLDPLAAPKPSDADGPDPRSPGQRLHDALADAAARLLASGDLPPSGGTPATRAVDHEPGSAREPDRAGHHRPRRHPLGPRSPPPGRRGERHPRRAGFHRHPRLRPSPAHRLGRAASRVDRPGPGLLLPRLRRSTGLVTTAHGGTLSVATALQLAGQASVIPVVLDSTGILAHGQARRTATIGQRLALAARDQGCCFPGCDAPPGWTQVHHILPWALGGGTDLDNECLLCGFHHREHEKRGWQVTMTGGQPYWIPHHG